MANTYSQLYIQIVFAVKYRRALLDKAWRDQVFAVMGNIINEKGCKNLIVNGVEDHVHCFLSLKPIVSISELTKAIKARSSKYINDHGLVPQRFEWQRGFGAFSYRQSDMDQIFNYVKNQEIHHQKIRFTEEYLELLKEFEVEYDEEYLFEDLL